MPNSESLSVSVVVEKEKIDHPWQEFRWQAIGLLPQVITDVNWREIARDEKWIQFQSQTVPIQLFRSDTEAYIDNLNNKEPVVYVIMSENDQPEGDVPLDIHMVTASPYEAQDYLDSGEDIVDTITMSEEIRAWIEKFVNENHSQEKFKKRKNDRVNPEDHKFGQEPIFVTRKRREWSGNSDG